MKEGAELTSGSAVFSLVPSPDHLMREKIIKLVWGEPNCGQKITEKFGKAWNFLRKEESFWWHQQNSHLFFSDGLLITRVPQGSLGNSTSGTCTKMYTLVWENEDAVFLPWHFEKRDSKMLRHACRRLNKMYPQKQLWRTKGSRIEQRKKTNWDAVLTATLAHHSKSFKV